jgi:hypothetical protein
MHHPSRDEISFDDLDFYPSDFDPNAEECPPGNAVGQT